MARVLIINPNTSTSVTDALAAAAHAQLSGDTFDIVTARFGAHYIASETAYAIASHAVLDAYAFHTAHTQVDGVLIGCFGDPGLLALRELCSVPVEGLAQAAMREAAQLGRFAIVTGGPRWMPMLERLAFSLQLQDSLAGIEILAQSGLDLAANRPLALDLLEQACRNALVRFQPDALILGGAALAGMASDLSKRLGRSVIDSVDAGLRALQRAAHTPRLAVASMSDGADYTGVSVELSACLNG